MISTQEVEFVSDINIYKIILFDKKKPLTVGTITKELDKAPYIILFPKDISKEEEVRFSKMIKGRVYYEHKYKQFHTRQPGPKPKQCSVQS